MRDLAISLLTLMKLAKAFVLLKVDKDCAYGLNSYGSLTHLQHNCIFFICQMSTSKCLGFLLPIINFFRVFISCVCAKLTSRLGVRKLLYSGLNWERILTKRDKNLPRAWKQRSATGKIKTGSPFETTRAQRFVFSRASSRSMITCLFTFSYSPFRRS